MNSMNSFSKRRLPRLGVGLGYRSAIHDDIMRSLDSIDWLEIVADQFMPLNSTTKSRLAEFRRGGPCVSHSLEMSVASITPPPVDYARSIIDVADILAAPWFSDHLAFNRLASINTGAFLPPFRDMSSVYRIAERIRALQAGAERPFLLENVAGVIDPGGELDEVDFLNEVTQQADCGILLDLANLVGRCLSLEWDICDYLDRLNLDRVTQIHVAGGRWHDGHLRDTHDQPVSDDVWSLLAQVADRTSINAVLIERDANFPSDFENILAELDHAREILADPRSHLRPFTGVPGGTISRLDILSQQEFEETVERVVLAAGRGSDERLPPSRSPRDDQWRELRRFGAGVLNKRGELLAAVFPATLMLLAAPGDNPRALINEFAIFHPRVRAFEDDVGFRVAEISRFSSFAAMAAADRELSAGARAVISYEAALAAATTVEQFGRESVDCPTAACGVANNRLDLCTDATIALADSVHLVSVDFNVSKVRAAVLAGQATSPADLDRLCAEHNEPTDLLVAPSSAGRPRFFRLGRRESACLQSILGTRADRDAPTDDFGRSLLGAAFRAHTIVITHPNET